jgi:hypothetical protein
MKMPERIPAVLVGLFAVVTVSASMRADVPLSDRMGVYCIVDKVVLEPKEAANTAQVHGTCAIADAESWYFEAPARGYFYYTVPAGGETNARREWADLSSVAGTKQVVAFGRRYHPVGRLRPTTEAPAKPDTYPLHFGVIKFTGAGAPEVRDVAEKIKAVHEKKEPDLRKIKK